MFFLFIGGAGDGGEEDGVCMMIMTLIATTTVMDSVMIAHMDQGETNAA